MKRSILEIYALLACLITLLWAVVVIGLGIYDLIRISSPQLTIPTWDYGKYLTNERYLDFCCNSKESLPKLSNEEVTRRRIEGMQIALKEEQRAGTQSLIRNLIALFLNAIVFIAHWKLAKRARESFVV